MPQNHQDLVAGQFGPQADAYVASAVHAAGEDLEQLAAAVQSRPVARALDLGCGGGHVSFRLSRFVGEMIAYDLSPDMLAAVAREAARRGLSNIATRQGRVERLPFPSDGFDLVVSRFSAHHWQDLATALREARRVLKAHGRAVFIDVVAPPRPLMDTYLQSIELLRDPSHVRDYSELEWRRALASAGFAPGEAVMRRLRLDFASWTARMRTPDLYVQSIRALQAQMPREAHAYFELEEDGSFTVETMTVEAAPV